MRDDEPISAREQRSLLILAALFLSFWLIMEAKAALDAWTLYEASAARWSYVAAPRLPPNCGWVLEQIICVSTELAGR